MADGGQSSPSLFRHARISGHFPPVCHRVRLRKDLKIVLLRFSDGFLFVCDGRGCFLVRWASAMISVAGLPLLELIAKNSTNGDAYGFVFALYDIASSLGFVLGPLLGAFVTTTLNFRFVSPPQCAVVAVLMLLA